MEAIAFYPGFWVSNPFSQHCLTLLLTGTVYIIWRHINVKQSSTPSLVGSPRGMKNNNQREQTNKPWKNSPRKQRKCKTIFDRNKHWFENGWKRLNKEPSTEWLELKVEMNILEIFMEIVVIFRRLVLKC